MRLTFTLVSLLFFSFAADAQKITGIWRGYFNSSSNSYSDKVAPEFYKYEIQILQQSNNSVQGVTYSYKTTVFYGKAALQGIYNKTTKSLVLKETSMLDLKIADMSEPCLMTCYLDYAKVGSTEVLQGSFISVNLKDKRDCGSGNVYLEKVLISDFKKEDFLLKKGTIDDTERKKALEVLKSKPLVKKTAPVVPPIKPPDAKTTAPKNPATSPTTTKKAIPENKPKQPAASVTTSPKPYAPTTDQPVSVWKSDTAAHARKEMISPKAHIPQVLLERDNNLIKTIYTGDEVIQIEIYDNGTIDNDTISLFHNNKLVVSHARLTYTPITIKIKTDQSSPHHEFVMVAENLGEIPPNTALMVVTVGKNKYRYEVFLSSNEKRNAKVVFEFKPGD